MEFGSIQRIAPNTAERFKEGVDLMRSDPLLTVFEAKIVCFFASTAVMNGSDPIESTQSRNVLIDEKSLLFLVDIIYSGLSR